MTSYTCKARYPLDLDGHAIQCARDENHTGEHTTAPQGWNDYSTFSFDDQPECWDTALVSYRIGGAL